MLHPHNTYVASYARPVGRLVLMSPRAVGRPLHVNLQPAVLSSTNECVGVAWSDWKGFRLENGFRRSQHAKRDAPQIDDPVCDWLSDGSRGGVRIVEGTQEGTQTFPPPYLAGYSEFERTRRLDGSAGITRSAIEATPASQATSPTWSRRRCKGHVLPDLAGGRYHLAELITRDTP